MIKTEWYVLLNGTASKRYPYIREIESKNDLRIHEQRIKKKLKWPYRIVFGTIKSPAEDYVPPVKPKPFKNTFTFRTDTNLIKYGV